MKRLAIALGLFFFALSARAEPVAIKVGVLRQEHSRETLSILDIPAADDALAGALLMVREAPVPPAPAEDSRPSVLVKVTGPSDL